MTEQRAQTEQRHRELLAAEYRALGIGDFAIWGLLNHKTEALTLTEQAALRAIASERARTIEECARVADNLGGERERPPLREGNDAEARSQQVIRAQHVRAKSITTAIRALLNSDAIERGDAGVM